MINKALIDQLVDGSWVSNDVDFHADNVQLFERDCKKKGALFIALSDKTFRRYFSDTNYVKFGSRKSYDFHGAVKKLAREGYICAAIVEREVKGVPSNFPQLVVDDSFAALEAIAKYKRELTSATCVAITGTVGKSSTKKMLRHLLRGDKTLRMPSGNNRQPIALGLANFRLGLDYWIFEVAQSALWSDDDGIAPILRPDISIITNIGLSQVHKVKSEKETVEIKSKIIKWIKPGGVVIFNRGILFSDYIESLAVDMGAKVISYGSDSRSDIRLLRSNITDNGQIVRADGICGPVEFELSVPGWEMAENALGALAVIYAQGLSVQKCMKKLATYVPANSSESFIKYELDGDHLLLIDGSYSAQLPAIISSLKIAKEDATTNRLILVLGRIIGMGDQAEAVHRSLKVPVIESGAEKVYTIGEEMKYLREELPESILGGHFDSAIDCAEAVNDELTLPMKILVKGSARGTDLRQFSSELGFLLKQRGAVESKL